MKYLNQQQSTITLPSGATVTVRRQTKLESIIIGPTPSAFRRRIQAKQRNEHEPELSEADEAAISKYLALAEKILLTRCVIGPVDHHGEKFTISDKDPGQTGDGEISWALIEDKDREATIAAINKLSGFEETAREDVSTTFQEANRTTDGSGQDRQALPAQPA